MSFDARVLPPTLTRNVTVTKFNIETDEIFNISMNWLVSEVSGHVLYMYSISKIVCSQFCKSV